MEKPYLSLVYVAAGYEVGPAAGAAAGGVAGGVAAGGVAAGGVAAGGVAAGGVGGVTVSAGALQATKARPRTSNMTIKIVTNLHVLFAMVPPLKYD
jgi:RNA-splicing ligase RtcB